MKLMINSIWLRFSVFGLLILMQCYHCQRGFAQEIGGPTDLGTISSLPLSPNAASLGRFDEMPVSSHTGIPDITIPIWRIQLGDVDLPISLSYHGGGIKVDEIASWVGLGWSLNSGGSISRTVRGLIDDDDFSYNEINDFVNGTMSNNDQMVYLDRVLKGWTDSEPDLYYLNINGYSCQFFVDEHGNCITSPADIGLEIKRNNNFGGLSWLVTDNRGVKYTFNVGEHTETVHYSFSQFGNEDLHQNNGTASWYVSKIEDNKGNAVDFVYDVGHLSFDNKAVERANVYLDVSGNPSPSCVGVEFSAIQSSNIIGSARLSKIIYNGAEISFNVGSAIRMDLPDDRALDNIEVKFQDSLLKRFRFFTGYFNNNTRGTVLNRYYQYKDMDKYRLRLDSLREESMDGVLRPFVFSYISDIGLPYRLSNAQDDWGYFNGKDNRDFVSYVDLQGVKRGADKTIDHNSTKQFTLNRVAYPTGGYTEYEYEGNKYFYEGPPTFTERSIITLMGDNSIQGTGGDKDIYIEETQLDLSLFADTDPFRIVPNIDIEGFSPSCDCSFEFSLIKEGEPPITLVNNQPIHVPVANYTVRGVIIHPHSGNLGEKPYIGYVLNLIANVQDDHLVTEKDGPGIRVKRINSRDGTGQVLVKRFEYVNPVDASCSGIVGNLPEYLVSLEKIFADVYTTGLCEFNQYSSVSNYPLLNTNSSYVGYSFVTEYYDDNGIFGKKVSQFTNFDLHLDLNYVYTFPFVPHFSQARKRGLSLNEWIYGQVDGQYALKQKRIKKYGVLENSSDEKYGVKAGITKSWHSYFIPTLEVRNDHTVASPYVLATDAFKLLSDSIVVFDGAAPIETASLYEYSYPYFLVKKISTYDSRSNALVTENKYPFDMVAEGRDPDGVYGMMVTENLVAMTVEESVHLNNDLLSDNKNSFASPLAGVFLPDSIKFWNRETNADETRFVYTSYDQKGNVCAISTPDGIVTCYIYGYNHWYPIAEVKNADLAMVRSILGGELAVESFGEEHKPTDEDVANFLAPLRSSAQLREASITTYSYAPLVGMTGRTDPSGRTTYYDYDGLGRLTAMRDQEGKVLESYCYNHAGQQVDCMGGEEDQ